MRLRAVAAALLVLLTVSSCGVGTDSAADVADDEAVPFGLLDENRDPVTGGVPGGVVVEVYLHADSAERLFPVARRIDSADLGAVLAELERPASAAEAATDLRSALGELDAISDVEVDGEVAIVDLTDDFSDISGADQLVAIAQIVFTATARAEIGQVAFTLEGEAIDVPRGDGSLTSGPLGRDDYESLAPAAT